MGKIVLEQVTKSFGEVNVIPPLDLEINEGEFVVFVGPSECTELFLKALHQVITHFGVMISLFVDNGPGFISNNI